MPREYFREVWASCESVRPNQIIQIFFDICITMDMYVELLMNITSPWIWKGVSATL